MSQEDRPSTPPIHPDAPKEPADDTAPSDPKGRHLAEEYLKYRQAEREEEKRLERYERTSSRDTTREKDDTE